MRWQDSIGNSSLAYTNALEAGVSAAKAKRDWEGETLELMENMEQRGASKYGRILLSFKRLSAGEI